MESSIPGIIILIGILVGVALYILDGIAISSTNKTCTMIEEMGQCIDILCKGIKQYRKDIEELSKPENTDKRNIILANIEADPNYIKNEWLVAIRLDLLAINEKELLTKK